MRLFLIGLIFVTNYVYFTQATRIFGSKGKEQYRSPQSSAVPMTETLADQYCYFFLDSPNTDDLEWTDCKNNMDLCFKNAKLENAAINKYCEVCKYKLKKTWRESRELFEFLNNPNLGWSMKNAATLLEKLDENFTKGKNYENIHLKQSEWLEFKSFFGGLSQLDPEKCLSEFTDDYEGTKKKLKKYTEWYSVHHDAMFIDPVTCTCVQIIGMIDIWEMRFPEGDHDTDLFKFFKNVCFDKFEYHHVWTRYQLNILKQSNLTLQEITSFLLKRLPIAKAGWQSLDKPSTQWSLEEILDVTDFKKATGSEKDLENENLVESVAIAIFAGFTKKDYDAFIGHISSKDEFNSAECRRSVLNAFFPRKNTPRTELWQPETMKELENYWRTTNKEVFLTHFNKILDMYSKSSNDCKGFVAYIYDINKKSKDEFNKMIQTAGNNKHVQTA